MTFKAILPMSCLLLAACAHQPVAPTQTTSSTAATTTPAAPAAPSVPAYDEQTLSDLLVAEVAAQHGDLPKALGLYVKQTQKTGSAKLAQQAARLALYMGQAQTALDMTGIWLKQEPASLEALRINTLAHVLLGQPDAVAQDIDQQLRLDPEQALPQLLANSQELSQVQLQVLLTALAGLTERYPQQASLWFAKALTEQRRGHFQNAIDACDQALQLKPDHLESQLLKSRLLVQLEQPKKALKLLKKLEKRFPDKPQVAVARIHLLLQQQEFDDAKRAVQRFTKRFPEQQDMQLALALFALQQQDAKTAIPVLQKLQQDGYQSDDIALYLGQAEAMQENWQGAIDAFLKVKGKHELQAGVEAARLLYQQQQDDAASNLFAKLRTQHPKQAASLYAAEISLLTEQQQSERAWALLKQARKAWPKDTTLLYQQAMAEDQRGDHVAMEQDLHTLLKLDPNNVNALNALGYTLSNHSQRYQEAWYYIKRAHAREPNNPAIQDSLGWVLFRLGRFDEALPLLQQAYKAQPDPEVAAHLVQTLRALGKTDAAAQQLQQAQQQFPDNKFLNALPPKDQPAS